MPPHAAPCRPMPPHVALKAPMPIGLAAPPASSPPGNATGNPTGPLAGTCTSSLRALDWLNFFVADMQASVGPFLAVYLASQGWNELHVGLALTVLGVSAIAAQTPAGALVDRTRAKRALVAAATVLTALSALAVAFRPQPAVIYIAAAMMGVAGGVLGSAIYGITLGIAEPGAFGARQGRNQSFNAAGNIFASVAVGLAAYFIDNRTALFAGAAFAMPALLSLAALSAREINHERARGAQSSADASGSASPAGSAPPLTLRMVFARRPVLVFIACSVLFHFANGSMLPLVGQKLARGQGAGSMAFMAACVITTQCVAAAASGWIGRAAARGRKPLLLAGFAVLPLRGLLYTLTDSATQLVAIQVLDGIAVAVFGVVSVLVIADLTAGSGRFNYMLGAINTTVGIGAAASQVAGGEIVHLTDFRTGMILLSAVAVVALVLFAWAMPETRERRRVA
ncbi:MAG: major facilitator superfamily 1 [Betaproteobacteria bacterium]|nr:major facilitator superfamily 1 [Betaproteobacteria bacterium]